MISDHCLQKIFVSAVEPNTEKTLVTGIEADNCSTSLDIWGSNLSRVIRDDTKLEHRNGGCGPQEPSVQDNMISRLGDCPSL